MKHLITILFATVLITMTGCENTGVVSPVTKDTSHEITQEFYDDMYEAGCTLDPFVVGDPIDVETLIELNPNVFTLDTISLELTWNLDNCGTLDSLPTTLPTTLVTPISNRDVYAKSVYCNFVSDSASASECNFTRDTSFFGDTSVVVLYNTPHESKVTTTEKLYISEDSELSQIEITIKGIIDSVYTFTENNRERDSLTFTMWIESNVVFVSDITIKLCNNEIEYSTRLEYNNGNPSDTSLYIEFSIPLENDVIGMDDLIDKGDMGDINLRFTGTTDVVLDFELKSVILN